jgi:hypothetical protein
MHLKLLSLLSVAAIGCPLAALAQAARPAAQNTQGVVTVQGADPDPRLEAGAAALRAALGKTGAAIMVPEEMARRLRPDLAGANEGRPGLAKLEADYQAALRSFGQGQEEVGQNLLQYVLKELPALPDGHERFRLWLRVQVLTAYRLHENSEANVLQQNQATARGIMAEVWRAAPDVADLVKEGEAPLFARGEVPADFALLGEAPKARASLVVRSAVPDAEVYVQGRDVGTILNPFEAIELSRVPGNYVVTARARGVGRGLPVTVELGPKGTEVVLRAFVRADGASLVRSGPVGTCEELAQAGGSATQCPAVAVGRELHVDSIVEASVTAGEAPRLSASLYSVADGSRLRAADVKLADLRPADPRIDRLARYLTLGKLEGSDVTQVYPPPPPFWRTSRVVGTVLAAGAAGLGLVAVTKYQERDDYLAQASVPGIGGAESDQLTAQASSAEKSARIFAGTAVLAAVAGGVLFFVF